MEFTDVVLSSETMSYYMCSKTLISYAIFLEKNLTNSGITHTCILVIDLAYFVIPSRIQIYRFSSE